MVDGKIVHPDRVLNRDESPQFVDFNTLRGNNIRRRVASTGDSAVLPKQENRECVSIDVTMSLDGFLFGPHIIIARECLTESCAPDEVAVFDDCINEKLKYSTHNLISNNQCGVRTGVTLLQRYKLLDDSAVEREGQHERYFSSALLDQVNRQLHTEYSKGVREFKKTRKAQLAMEFQRSVDESEECVAPGEINREHFVVHAQPEVTDSAPPSFADFSGSPEGFRRGTPEYYKRKLAAIRALGQEWEIFETTPMLRGILEIQSVPKLPPKPSKGRLSDNNGSFTFNEIRKKKKAAKKQAEEAARLETEFRVLQRDLAKEQRDAENAATAATKR
ncbi:hypothetical protein CYMTET_4245 [Cymbomonas tetramitiformis]|uniref:Uncharacterized protein n=1 Tax=Cymbomonas tetramitiformis TaxID=36881 RepID=A0AAE0LK84_9CHLO|nr:hypothetical protein CYMTET_4245 [Cymbomonas tetramitiformis]